MGIRKSKKSSTREALSTAEDFRDQLDLNFKKRNWAEAVIILDRLAQFAEQEGQCDLCLRAQTLRSLVGDLDLAGDGDRAVADRALGNLISGLFGELVSKLAHLEWIRQPDDITVAPPEELV